MLISKTVTQYHPVFTVQCVTCLLVPVTLLVVPLLVVGCDFSPLWCIWFSRTLPWKFSNSFDHSSGTYQCFVTPAWHGQVWLLPICRCQLMGGGSVFCVSLHSCPICIPVLTWPFSAAPGTLCWGSHTSDILFYHTRSPPVWLEGS